MAPPRILTAEQAMTIDRLRKGGMSFEKIAGIIGVSKRTVIRCMDRVPISGIRIDNVGREPLPPGHPETWGVIVAGTCLAGMEYQP